MVAARGALRIWYRYGVCPFRVRRGCVPGIRLLSVSARGAGQRRGDGGLCRDCSGFVTVGAGRVSLPGMAAGPGLGQGKP